MPPPTVRSSRANMAPGVESISEHWNLMRPCLFTETILSWGYLQRGSRVAGSIFIPENLLPVEGKSFHTDVLGCTRCTEANGESSKRSDALTSICQKEDMKSRKVCYMKPGWWGQRSRVIIPRAQQSQVGLWLSQRSPFPLMTWEVIREGCRKSSSLI